MSDLGSSVTLIFYAIDRQNITSEPLLNIAAALAQWSAFTHVELAIASLSGVKLQTPTVRAMTPLGHALRQGEGAGAHGEMASVLRVFNDSVGVELAERTGRNPSFSYLQLGCSRNAEAAMMAFARRQVGKPFSPTGMARSIIYPRTPDGKSWCVFPCARAPTGRADAARTQHPRSLERPGSAPSSSPRRSSTAA